MTSHLGVLLDWTVADLAVLGIAIQQYISVSLDLKRSKAKAAAEASEPGHPERQ
jgi:hypothetical protein